METPTDPLVAEAREHGRTLALFARKEREYDSLLASYGRMVDERDKLREEVEALKTRIATMREGIKKAGLSYPLGDPTRLLLANILLVDEHLDPELAEEVNP